MSVSSAAGLLLTVFAALPFPQVDATRWQVVYTSERQRISVDQKTMKGQFGQFDVWIRTDFAEPVRMKGKLATFVLTRESIGCGGTTYTWEWVWYTRNGAVIKREEGASSSLPVPETEGEAAGEKLCRFLNAAIAARDYSDVADHASRLQAGGDADLTDAKSLCLISADKRTRDELFASAQDRANASQAGDREIQLTIRPNLAACEGADLGAAIGAKGAYLFRTRADGVIRVVLETEERIPARVAVWAINTVMTHE